MGGSIGAGVAYRLDGILGVIFVNSGQFPNKKVRETEVSRTIADFQAPLWEAPNGPPGGHFRAEEASPENIEPSLGHDACPERSGNGYVSRPECG